MDVRGKSVNEARSRMPSYLGRESTARIQGHRVIPFSHNQVIARALHYDEDTPIKGLESSSKNCQEKPRQNIIEKPIEVCYQPPVDRHARELTYGNLNQPPEAKNYIGQGALISKVHELTRQLEEERALNRRNSNRIAELTKENEDSRAQIKALSEQMTRMKQSFQNKSSAQQQSSRPLVDYRKSIDHFPVTKGYERPSSVPKTARLKATRNDLDETTQRRSELQMQRGLSHETMRRHLPNQYIQLGGPRRESSYERYMSLLKNTSCMLPDRGHLLNLYPPLWQLGARY